MKFELKKLTVHDGRDVYDMLQTMPADENGFMNGVNGMSFDEFQTWLVRQAESAEKTQIEDGWKVPQSTYWLYADGRPVGVGRIRHFLTDKLREEGGHIGYAIAPDARGRGYGKILLRELMKEAGKLGIDRALITVNNDNAASIKVALANGGRIEKVSNTSHYIWVDC